MLIQKVNYKVGGRGGGNDGHQQTLGMKISARKVVVRMNIPATNIPAPMLMYVLRENVTSASMTRTMLEM